MYNLYLFWLVWAGPCLVYCFVIRGLTGDFLMRRYFSGVVRQPKDLQVSQHIGFLESSSLIHQQSYP